MTKVLVVFRNCFYC